MIKLNCNYPIELKPTGSDSGYVLIYYQNIRLGGYNNYHRYIRPKEMRKLELFSAKEENLLRQNGFQHKKRNSGDNWWQSGLENKKGQAAVINHFCKLIDERGCGS